MTPTVLVGCPVLLRAWAMPGWFAHLDAAAARAGAHLEFIFVGASWDLNTWQAIHAGVGARDVTEITVPEPRHDDRRDWASPGRKQRMVDLRNTLLGRVRELAPDWFLSIDSDIDLHPDALGYLLETCSSRFDAAGAAVNLVAGAPNYYIRNRGGGLERPPQRNPVVIGVDVIAAVKLMSPAAYQIDYTYNDHGEDVGWSDAARAAGLRLGWDARCWSTHHFNAPVTAPA